MVRKVLKEFQSLSYLVCVKCGNFSGFSGKNASGILMKSPILEGI